MKQLYRFIVFSLSFTGLIVTGFSQNPYTDSLLKVLAQEENDSMRVENLYNVGSELFYYFPDSAIGYARQLLPVARKIQFREGEGYGFYLLASAYEIQENYDSAIYYMKSSIRIMQDLDDTSKLAVSYGALGSIFYEKRITDSAIHYFFKAKEIQTEADFLIDLTYTLNNIGEVYYQSFSDFPKAYQYYKQAYDIRIKYGSPKEIATSLTNLADVMSDLGKNDTALVLYFEALEYDKKIDSRHSIALIQNSVGMIFNELGNYEKSLAYHDSALTFYQKINHDRYSSVIHMNRAKALEGMKNYPAALEASDSVLWYAKKAEALNMMRSGYRTKFEIYESMGLAKEALEAHKQYFLYEDSLLKQDNRNLLEELEARYQNQELSQKNALQEIVIEQEQQKRTVVILVAALALIMVGGVLLFFLLNQRNKQLKTQMILSAKESEAQNLRELDQLKSRFFANISHEFRTPLTLILGPLQKLINGTVKGNPETYFQMMNRNADRLLQLINQLLDLSKLESGKLQLNLESGDIIFFFKGITGAFDSLAESRQIRFHTHFPSGPIHCFYDKDKLEKTFNNLLSNAFKFTPEGGDISFKVSLPVSPSLAGPMLDISIEDNGIGIPEDQIEHIFDRFYRVEGEVYQGTGIGLALVKELVELQNGEISVSSFPGKGSVFSVKLPLLLSEEKETIQPEEKQIAEAPTIIQPAAIPHLAESSTGQKPILLLVEDNDDVRAFIRSVLIEEYEVIEAENGIKGLKIAHERIPDLIISDVMMPEMDGNAFTKEIKTQETSSHIPVILLTAKAGQESKIEGLETGADDYLQKPFDEAELKARIKNLIEQRRKLRERFGKEVITIGPKEIAVTSADEEFIKKAMTIVEEYMSDETFSIEDLAGEMALSRSQLHRKIKALTDQSPSVFLRTMRLKRAYQLLEQKAGTASEISFLVGFSSPAYFSKCFKDQFGKTPVEVVA